MIRARDLFAGAGGWDIAARDLGWAVDGVEIMPAARDTRAAAGLVTVGADVRDVVPVEGEYDVDIASPPCQSFSMAGDGSGRRALKVVLAGIDAYAAGSWPTHRQLTALTRDERTALVLEPLRIALAGRSTYLAWEQVPPVLPVWEACAVVLRAAGYSVATGTLGAEQYGVPQTRKRAFLVARRDGGVASLPRPTHSRYYVRNPAKLDAGTLPWVSMAQALGWGMTGRPSMTVAGAPETGGAHAFANKGRAGMLKEANAGRWILRGSRRSKATERHSGEPAATIAFGNSPETAVWTQQEISEGADREVHQLSPGEAAVLQSFPDGFPFAGGKTVQFRQIGNAIPPVLAAAVLGSLGVPA